MTEGKSEITPIELFFEIERGDFVRAGEASSKIKKKLLRLGFTGSTIRCAAIATYEAEMNIVIHSLGGSLKVKIYPEKVVLVAKDEGPGIPDVALAMKEGFSTAPEQVREMGFGAGMGLPNMRNCADEFEIESREDVGTTVTMVLYKGG